EVISMTQPNCTHTCSSYHQAIEFIGKRWMGMIIYTLLPGPKRYHEIHASIPGISDRLLTDRLNELVNAGLIEKKFIDSSIKKVEYELTPNGIAFQEVIKSIKKWIDVCDFEKTTEE
ncbi:MAG: helix-turn-helix domain-containing protein, partial [Solibacillus sp.]